MNDKTKHIAYWVNTATDDLESMDVLFEGKKYVQALFFAHLSLEKILKAHWVVCNANNMPPKTHNLIYLYEKTNLKLSEEDTDFLQSMNVFQIEGRYPDYLAQLNKTVNKEQTETIIVQVKQLFVCLQEQLP
ncbi:MAG: HEPN domain-containing protein [Cytophagia bacterium]|nr:MAG: HEPN domain-containing protein [Cytophagales bacterium]TAG37416.1 MAG: HEPN domain-containing protein [Cytophagia bacterium]TAG71973.1 MAG: HEPN domain-containing protein [Runella slithyformis]TAG78457.1 MAG: HEPN domain-containing protein [Cytophagales bacterium]